MSTDKYEDDSQLSDIYRAASSERSPELLDQRILKAAKTAIEQDMAAAKTVAVPHWRWRRWSTPVAAAASLLLCFSLVLNVILYRPELTFLGKEEAPHSADDIFMLEPAERGSLENRLEEKPASGPVPARDQESKKKTIVLQQAPSASSRTISQSPSAFSGLSREKTLAGKQMIMPEEAELGTIMTDAARPALDEKLSDDERIAEIIVLLEAGKLKQAGQHLQQLLNDISNDLEKEK